MARSVMHRMKQLYLERLRPLEVLCHFEHFQESPMTECELEARPQVLLVGQYSTGKTSLVKWVTGIESTFFDIRPQPSTDRFMAIVHGEDERVINGDAATCVADLPYAGLQQFGSAFLSKFQVLVENATILKSITFVDTPGVLSGDKQRISRGYDFEKVCKWFAGRSDLILLLFDAHKLDISDELREVIEAIRADSNKCRCVLNKADEIDGENLVKVYGALMWNLGKILLTPEVARMYVGSFWDREYQCKDLRRLLDADKRDLVQELRDLPRSVCVRRLSSFVARARAVRVHLALGACLRSKLPTIGWCGRRHRYQAWLCEQLPDIYDEVVRDRQLSVGDLPPLALYREHLLGFPDFRNFPRWRAEFADELESMISVEVPQLMDKVAGVSASAFRPQSSTDPSGDGLDHKIGGFRAMSPRKVGGRCTLSCWCGWLGILLLALLAAFLVALALVDVPPDPVEEPPEAADGDFWAAVLAVQGTLLPSTLPPVPPPAPPPPPPPLYTALWNELHTRMQILMFLIQERAGRVAGAVSNVL